MITERLKLSRTQSGLTIRELGRLAGIHHTMLGRYESGDTRPSIDTLKRLAQSLGVSADYLLELSDDPAPRMSENTLTPQEQKIITLIRQQRPTDAIKIILDI